MGTWNRRRFFWRSLHCPCSTRVCNRCNVTRLFNVILFKNLKIMYGDSYDIAFNLSCNREIPTGIGKFPSPERWTIAMMVKVYKSFHNEISLVTAVSTFTRGTINKYMTTSDVVGTDTPFPRIFRDLMRTEKPVPSSYFLNSTRAVQSQIWPRSGVAEIFLCNCGHIIHRVQFLLQRPQ